MSFTVTGFFHCVAAAPAEFVLYQTGFEFGEGFTPGFKLVNQGGWVGTADGGNGVETGLIEGIDGQQAFIGFGSLNPPGERILGVLKPVNYTPAIPSQSIVRFSVQMQIVPSTNQIHDYFRWSVYNTQAKRLFSLDFDVASSAISYLPEGSTNYLFSGLNFDSLGFYDLDIWMDLNRNRWMALMNDVVVVNSKPITTGASLRTIGDVDAVWDIQSLNTENNDYMIFDNYKLAVIDLVSVPATIEQLGISADRGFDLRIYGQAGLKYAIEATSDWKAWQPLITVTAPEDGIIQFRAPIPAGAISQFFRARHVP